MAPPSSPVRPSIHERVSRKPCRNLDRPLVLADMAGDKIPPCDDIGGAEEEPEYKCSFRQLTGQQDVTPFVMSGTDAFLQVFIPPPEVNSQPH